MAELQFVGKLSLGGHGDPQSIFNHIRSENWGIVRRQRVVVATTGVNKGTVTVAEHSGTTVTHGPIMFFAVKGGPGRFKIQLDLAAFVAGDTQTYPPECRGVFTAFLNATENPIIIKNATTCTGGQTYDFVVAQRGTNF